MMNGTCDDFDDQMKPLLKIISKEIVKQRTRLGGDFAVAQAVVSRYGSIRNVFIACLLADNVAEILNPINQKIITEVPLIYNWPQVEPRLVPGAPGQGERDLRGDEPDQELPAGAAGGAARRGHGRRVRRHHQQGGYLYVTFTHTHTGVVQEMMG